MKFSKNPALTLTLWNLVLFIELVVFFADFIALLSFNICTVWPVLSLFKINNNV